MWRFSAWQQTNYDLSLVCEEPASLLGGPGGGAAGGGCYPAHSGSSSRRHPHQGGDMDGDIDQNREFYRGQDVRPPYTYAALIRQVLNNHTGDTQRETGGQGGERERKSKGNR